MMPTGFPPRHNILLEQMDTRLRIPSVYKAGGVAFGISAVLLGIAGGLYFEWTLQPDYLDTVGESTEWLKLGRVSLVGPVSAIQLCYPRWP